MFCYKLRPLLTVGKQAAAYISNDVCAGISVRPRHTERLIIEFVAGAKVENFSKTAKLFLQIFLMLGFFDRISWEFSTTSCVSLTAVRMLYFSDCELCIFDQVVILRLDVVFSRLSVVYLRPPLGNVRPLSCISSAICWNYSTLEECKRLICK